MSFKVGPGQINVRHDDRQWQHEIEGERIIHASLDAHVVMARWLLKRLATAPRLVAWHQRKFAALEQELEIHHDPQKHWLAMAFQAIADQAPEYGGGTYTHSSHVANNEVEFAFLVGSAMRATSDMGIREDEVIAAYLLIYPER